MSGGQMEVLLLMKLKLEGLDIVFGFGFILRQSAVLKENGV